MCGRFEIRDGQRIFIRFHVATPSQTPTQPMLPNLDVRPTQQVPVLLADHQLALMRWGLTPRWSKDGLRSNAIINARAEGIASKPTFRQPIRSQRCLLPASAFFEWHGSPSGAKTKYRIGRRDGELFAMAGLFDTWKTPSGAEIQSCAIITCAPNELMAPIHDRMPVILLPDDEEAWLDPDLVEVEQITSYLRPYPDELLEAAQAS
jgi:putative SOS response-associated peptidase YedK